VTALTANPDAGLVLLTIGLLLIYLECNRPGRVVPLGLGLLAVLVALHRLQQTGIRECVVVAGGLAVVLFLLELYRPVPMVVPAAATLAMFAAFDGVRNRASSQIEHGLVAASCALVLGVSTSWLARIAYRARANKAVNYWKRQ